MTGGVTEPAQAPRTSAYWTLRVLESGLLLGALVGICLFAYSLIDIIRIETAKVPSAALPPSAWPGVFTFFGCMIALQIVRTVLHRYRRDDGSPRGDARGVAADTTNEVLASVPDEDDDIISAEAGS